MTQDTCSHCGEELAWGEMLIRTYRMNREGKVEKSGYAHARHYRNPEESASTR